MAVVLGAGGARQEGAPRKALGNHTMTRAAEQRSQSGTLASAIAMAMASRTGGSQGMDARRPRAPVCMHVEASQAGAIAPVLQVLGSAALVAGKVPSAATMGATPASTAHG